MQLSPLSRHNASNNGRYRERCGRFPALEPFWGENCQTRGESRNNTRSQMELPWVTMSSLILPLDPPGMIARSLCVSSLRIAIRVASVVIVLQFETPADAHTTADFLPLKFQGHIAPFGFDETETYTQVWGDGEFAYIGSLSSGVAIVDKSNIEEVSIVSVYGSNLGVGFHDVRTADRIGFFSTHADGTHVVDLSTPQEPRTLSRVAADSLGFDFVTNATIEGDYLYQVSDKSSEIAITDISNPAFPEFFARLDTEDSVGIYDLTIADNRLYAAGLGGQDGEGATYVYEISGPDNPEFAILGQIATGENTASVWPTADHSTLIVTQRKVGGEVAAWSISDLSSPQRIDRADASDFGINAYSAGEAFILGNTAYTAWHQAGVQVIDLDLLEETDILFRAGAFGTSQASPVEKFVGNTSVHPLAHDEVLLGDSRWGLYFVNATNVVSIPSAPDLETVCAKTSVGTAHPNEFSELLNTLGILAGDADQNGRVEFSDFLKLSRNFGQENVGFSGGDFDCSGDVGFLDFLLLSDNFGASSDVATVPEPNAPFLWMLVLLLLLQITRPRSV